MTHMNTSGERRRQQRCPKAPLSLPHSGFLTFFKELAAGRMRHLVYVLLKGVHTILFQECAYGGICVFSNKDSFSSLFFSHLNWNQDLTENLHFVSFQSLVLLLDQPSK